MLVSFAIMIISISFMFHNYIILLFNSFCTTLVVIGIDQFCLYLILNVYCRIIFVLNMNGSNNVF